MKREGKIAESGLHVFDIRNFGASEIATPSINAAAIQAALDAAADAGGGMVVVPPGTWNTTTTVSPVLWLKTAKHENSPWSVP